MKQLHPKAVWLFFIHGILGFVIFSVLTSFIFLSPLIAVVSSLQFNIFGILLFTLFLYFAASILISYIYAKLTYRFYRYGLTTEGIKIERGIIWKCYVTIPYGRIQNVDIYRGPLARILGLSDLQIQTAGYSYGRGRSMFTTEGRLPGLFPQDAEALRDELIKKVESKSQGL